MRKDSPLGDSWRLVHDGVKVLSLIRYDQVTTTVNELEVFPVEDGDFDAAKAAAEARITELGLQPSAPTRPKFKPPVK